MYARGNNRAAVFLDDWDRRRYLRLLQRAVEWHRWHLLAYCLLDNHVHLLVETQKPNLGAGLRQAHGAYAQTFNRRHDRCGHVFQGRYGAVAVADDAQLWTVARYVVRNPVESGLCREPIDWPWSSHRDVCLGTAPSWLAVDRLFALFAGFGGEPAERYVEAVEAT